MDEPDRLLNQSGSALEQALLREGQGYQGAEDLRAKTLAALGLASSAGLATGGVLAWLSVRSWGTKFLLTLSAASVLVGIPMGYFALKSSQVSTPPPARRPAEAPIPMAPQATVAAAAQPPRVEEPGKPPETAPAAVPEPLPAHRSRRGGSSSSALRAELAALDPARAALADGNALEAISFLSMYFRTFPRGRLLPEAEVLRIRAFAKGGRMDEAKEYAQEFLRRHPHSVLAARVQPFVKR